MRLLQKSEVVSAFRELGLVKGDIVHVQSDLRSIGPVDAELTRDGQCGFYLEALQEVVGQSGTVTCCTAFEDYGRFGTTFVREESPSRTDTFSEYLRTRPGAVRSMHPIVSVAGLGSRSEEICGGDHYSGFGYSSPWGRLHRANAKLLTLGISASDEGGMTFLHHVEAMYGVPYQYVKIFTSPVIVNGQRVNGSFTLHVRYLDFGITNCVLKLKSIFLLQGQARQVRTGRSWSYCVGTQKAFSLMVENLERDLWVYLRNSPRFRNGEIPMDGPTGGMRIDVNKSGQ
jgi:aminoglycoside 3-N-acetyltransferase